MRTREAWLTAITAALGLAEGCHREAAPSPAPSTSAAVVPVAAATPSTSETTSAAVAPSATPSAPVAPSASVATSTTASIGTADILRALGGSNATCGARNTPDPVDLSRIGGTSGICGASDGRLPDSLRAPVANVTVTSSSTTADDQRVLALLRPRIRMCANKGLANDPNEHGTVHATISVGANGEVTSVDGVTGTGLGSGTQQCMVAQMRRPQFTPGPAHKVPVVVTSAKQ